MPRIESPASPLVSRLRGLHLFHFEGAPCAQRVRFALAEKGLRRGLEVAWRSDSEGSLTAAPGTWSSRHVSLVRKDHLTDEYAAIHPHMVVPALVQDGELWIESMDIVEHLDDVFPGPRLLPSQPSAREDALALVEQAKELHRSVRYVSFHWGLGRLGRIGAAKRELLRRLERPNSPERLLEFYGRFDEGAIDLETNRAHLAALEKGFGELEARLASDGRAFLLGSDLTVADIPWSIKVLRLTECGYPFGRNFPALWAWFGRISARPGFRRGVMAHHGFLSQAFRAKAAVENWLGVGLVSEARRVA
jgi:glutathione S-transferase